MALGIQNTVWLTVISGVLVFVIGRFLVRFIVEPLNRMKEIQEKITEDLIFYSHWTANPSTLTDDEKEELQEEMRRNASMLRSRMTSVPFYSFLAFLQLAPHPYSVREAALNLVGLSNSSWYADKSDKSDVAIENEDKRKNIIRLLNLDVKEDTNTLSFKERRNNSAIHIFEFTAITVFFLTAQYLFYQCGKATFSCKYFVLSSPYTEGITSFLLSNYIHGNKWHFLSNIGLFFLAYLYLRRQESDRRFALLFIGIMVGGAMALSYLNVIALQFTSFSVQSLGFSSVLAVFLGMIPFYGIKHIKQREDWFPHLSTSGLVVVFVETLIALRYRSFWVVGIGLMLIIMFMWRIRTVSNLLKKNDMTLATASLFIFLIPLVTVISLFPVEIVKADSIINIIAHYNGLVIGMVLGIVGNFRNEINSCLFLGDG